MKRILSVLFTGLVSITTLAQSQNGNGKITGVVLDNSNQQPVEFATIALEDLQSKKPVNGTVADEKGKFVIPKVANGTYRIVISFIGYENIAIENVTITDKKNHVDLGTQKIKGTTKQLDEVVVEGQRNLVEEKVDRTVYNAENDVTTKGGDGTDVLRRVPMLTVDTDGNVSLRGNQNIRVLINNKPSTIAASSVGDALKQIPADQIKSVEVITSPSAKYDAEGSAGIINIITKKNTMKGLTLGMDASAGFRGANLGLNGSYRTGKMGFSLGGFGRSNYNITGSYLNNQLTTQTVNGAPAKTLTTQEATTLNRGLFGNYNLGWDYDINKFNSLTASVRLGGHNGRNFQNDLFTERYTEGGTFLNNTLNNVDVKNLSENLDASLTYTRSFETPGREFSLLGSFNRNNRTNNFINDFSLKNNQSIDSLVRNDNKSFNQEMTIQADYETPIGKNQKLELGGKNILRSVSSRYQYFTSLNGGSYLPLLQSNLSNDFDYDQNIMAGYLSYTLNLPKQYSIKAGTRFEHTNINANFIDQEKIEIPSYNVVVPSVNISKRFEKGSSLKLAYNRRIQRPSLQFLNPNLQASNPVNATQGNPYLSPEYTNNFEFAYSTFVKKTSYNISTFIRNTNNAIQSVREATVLNIGGVDRDAILTTYQNIGSENAYGASFFTNINVSEKFSLNAGTDFYYAMLNNNSDDENYKANNQGWVYNARLFGNYNFTKLWGMQFFGFFRGREVQLQGVRGGFAMYSASIKRDFANKKGSVGVGVENFLNFNGFKIKSETVSPVIVQNSVNTLNNLSFKVNFSYRIGKMSFDQPKRRKSVNNDDLKGEGGGDGGMGNNDGGQPQGGQKSGGGMTGGGAGTKTPATNSKMAKVDAAAVVNAEGTWTYTVESPQGGGGKLILKKEGENLTGSIISNRNNREVPLKTVTLVGNEVTIVYEMNFNGNTMTGTIKGTIKEDDLNGTMSVGQFGSFPINAKREKK
jgi:outer membrane receptor protein involved in Fe transport